MSYLNSIIYDRSPSVMFHNIEHFISYPIKICTAYPHTAHKIILLFQIQLVAVRKMFLEGIEIFLLLLTTVEGKL